MELREYLEIIRKRLWIIVYITVLAVAVTALLSYFLLDRIYEASATLIVSKTGDSSQFNQIQYNDILLNQKLVKTYSILAKSNRILEQVRAKLDLDLTLKELQSKISVNSEGETEIIRITVEDPIPERAMNIANTLAEVFRDEVKTFLLMDNVQIIDRAKLPTEPVKPKPLLNIVIAGFIGIMVGFGVVFLIEYLDNTVKTPEDIEAKFELPVLGTIPDFNK